MCVQIISLIHSYHNSVMFARTGGKKRKTFMIYGCPLSELLQVETFAKS